MWDGYVSKEAPLRHISFHFPYLHTAISGLDFSFECLALPLFFLFRCWVKQKQVKLEFAKFICGIDLGGVVAKGVMQLMQLNF